MKLYHRTDQADAIIRGGFRDGTGTYLTSNAYSGVWLSDEPLDPNDGAFGRFLLTVDIPETLIDQYEWSEEGKGFREFLVPADLVNKFGPARIEDDEGPNPPWAIDPSSS